MLVLRETLKLHALGRKKPPNTHHVPFVLVLDILSALLIPFLTFPPPLANLLFFNFFLFHLVYLRFLQTGSHMFVHPWHPLCRRLFHPPTSCLFTHLRGQLHAPLSSQCSHTHSLSKTTLIPQCTCIPPVCNRPTMPSAYWPCSALQGSCESRFLSSSSFLSAPHFGDIHVIYFMSEDSISPSVTCHTIAFSLSTGVSFLQHIRAP